MRMTLKIMMILGQYVEKKITEKYDANRVSKSDRLTLMKDPIDNSHDFFLFFGF